MKELELDVGEWAMSGEKHSLYVGYTIVGVGGRWKEVGRWEQKTYAHCEYTTFHL
jgi:hypothetical protein